MSESLITTQAQIDVAGRLLDRGHPLVLAIRVACTRPFAVNAPADDDVARPGLEIAESIERNTPIVIGCLVAAVVGGEAVSR